MPTLNVTAFWRGSHMWSTATFSLDKVAAEARDDLLADARERILREDPTYCSSKYDEAAPVTQYLCGDAYSENCPTMPGRGRILTLRP
jgi:hypothetical protein